MKEMQIRQVGSIEEERKTLLRGRPLISSKPLECHREKIGDKLLQTFTVMRYTKESETIKEKRWEEEEWGTGKTLFYFKIFFKLCCLFNSLSRKMENEDVRRIMWVPLIKGFSHLYGCFVQKMKEIKWFNQGVRRDLSKWESENGRCSNRIWVLEHPQKALSQNTISSWWAF